VTRCLASMMSRTAVRTTFTNHMLNTTWYQHRPQDRASHKASSCIQLVHLRTCSRKWTSPKMTVSCSTLGVMRLWRLTQTATQSMTLSKVTSTLKAQYTHVLKTLWKVIFPKSISNQKRHSLVKLVTLIRCMVKSNSTLSTKIPLRVRILRWWNGKAKKKSSSKMKTRCIEIWSMLMVNALRTPILKVSLFLPIH
jgi:hypothetical protein